VREGKVREAKAALEGIWLLSNLTPLEELSSISIQDRVSFVGTITPEHSSLSLQSLLPSLLTSYMPQLVNVFNFCFSHHSCYYLVSQISNCDVC
jgi:hypothetical protein